MALSGYKAALNASMTMDVPFPAENLAIVFYAQSGPEGRFRRSFRRSDLVYRFIDILCSFYNFLRNQVAKKEPEEDSTCMLRTCRIRHLLMGRVKQTARMSTGGLPVKRQAAYNLDTNGRVSGTIIGTHSGSFHCRIFMLGIRIDLTHIQNSRHTSLSLRCTWEIIEAYHHSGFVTVIWTRSGWKMSQHVWSGRLQFQFWTLAACLWAGPTAENFNF